MKDEQSEFEQSDNGKKAIAIVCRFFPKTLKDGGVLPGLQELGEAGIVCSEVVDGIALIERFVEKPSSADLACAAFLANTGRMVGLVEELCNSGEFESLPDPVPQLAAFEESIKQEMGQDAYLLYRDIFESYPPSPDETLEEETRRLLKSGSAAKIDTLVQKIALVPPIIEAMRALGYQKDWIHSHSRTLSYAKEALDICRGASAGLDQYCAELLSEAEKMLSEKINALVPNLRVPDPSVL